MLLSCSIYIPAPTTHVVSDSMYRYTTAYPGKPYADHTCLHFCIVQAAKVYWQTHYSDAMIQYTVYSNQNVHQEI